MTVKRRPHHDLSAIQAKFVDVDSLSITTTANRDAQAIGYSLEDVIDAVQALEPQDFVKSATAHNPVNYLMWHDTYVIPYDGMDLYLKFAGETLVDIVLTSFKESFP